MTSRTLAAPLALTALLLAGCSSEEAERQEAFCAEVPDLLAEITDDVDAAGSDPQSAPQVLDEADLTDPAADAGLAPQLQELQGDLVSAGGAVDAYGEENC